MYIISSNHFPWLPADQLTGRITSKKNLWEHFDNILAVLPLVQYSTAELEEQLITDTIRYLHPSFSGQEILQEIPTILNTFAIPQTAAMHGIFTVAYLTIVKAKLKAHGNKEKDSPENRY